MASAPIEPIMDPVAEPDANARTPEVADDAEAGASGQAAASQKNAQEKSADSLAGWPAPIRDGLRWADKKAADIRHGSIMATPAYAVNNSSNILGISHVLTEMLMFKSGMKGARLIDNPKNPMNWVWEPLKNIGKDIFVNSKARDYSLLDIFRGNPIKNANKYIFDTHDASLREIGRQTVQNAELAAIGKPIKKLSLGNPWQTRTTGTGLFIWTLSALIPEKKESDQEIERMAIMRATNPLEYVGVRLKQAVWLPEWNVHKREMLGLGYLAIGVFSGLGSWRNRKELNIGIAKEAELIGKGLKQGYTFNPGYLVTSIISFICGLPLLFALDERKAYSTYGAFSMARIPFLFQSLGSKIGKKEEGWVSYVIGKLTFQVEDLAFSLVGGATKIEHPDGTVEIVDHEQLKKRAKAEALREKALAKIAKHERDDAEAPAEKSEHVSEAPSTRINSSMKMDRVSPAAPRDEQLEVTDAVGATR